MRILSAVKAAVRVQTEFALDGDLLHRAFHLTMLPSTLVGGVVLVRLVEAVVGPHSAKWVLDVAQHEAARPDAGFRRSLKSSIRRVLFSGKLPDEAVPEMPVEVVSEMRGATIRVLRGLGVAEDQVPPPVLYVAK